MTQKRTTELIPIHGLIDRAGRDATTLTADEGWMAQDLARRASKGGQQLSSLSEADLSGGGGGAGRRALSPTKRMFGQAVGVGRGETH